MPDKKISAFTAATSALAADEFVVNEAGTTKKLTLDQLQQLFFISGKYAPGTFTVPDGQFVQMGKNLTLTGTQRATLVGTARLRID